MLCGLNGRVSGVCVFRLHRIKDTALIDAMIELCRKSGLRPALSASIVKGGT